MNQIRSLEKGQRFFRMPLEEQEKNFAAWAPEDEIE